MIIYICNANTLEAVLSDAENEDKPWTYFLLLTGYQPGRADYIALAHLLNGHRTSAVKLYLMEEFNPVRDFININFASKFHICYPEKMPVQTTIDGHTFIYDRRIFPYPGSKFDVTKARMALRDISIALNKIGLDWHISFGSLLGLVRDQDLIPWDNDLDAVIKISSKEFS